MSKPLGRRRWERRIVTVLIPISAWACAQESPGESATAPTSEAVAPPAADTKDSETLGLPPGDGPVAKVNGVDIPRADFNRAYIQTIERYLRAKHDVKPALQERLKDNIVRRLVDQAIVSQRAQKMGITLDPDEISAKWAEHKKRYGSDEAFAAFLERAGTTADDVRQNFENNHLREAVFERIGRDVTVSGDEIRAFFEENRQRYDEPEMVRASHVLVRVPPGASKEVVEEKRATAEKVRKEAMRKDADFAAIARKYGEDPTKDRGGDLGFFPKGRMVKAFEDAVWPLKKGQVSKVVKTQFGFHVIKKTDRRGATRKQLEDVAEQIERSLLARKRNQAIRDAVESWKEEAEVEIFVKGDPDIINAAYDRPPARPSPLVPSTVGGEQTPPPSPSSPGSPSTD